MLRSVTTPVDPTLDYEALEAAYEVAVRELIEESSQTASEHAAAHGLTPEEAKAVLDVAARLDPAESPTLRPFVGYMTRRALDVIKSKFQTQQRFGASVRVDNVFNRIDFNDAVLVGDDSVPEGQIRWRADIP